ncbi:hypothetical protein V6N13_059650 [Hibiscus sabdariffa]
MTSCDLAIWGSVICVEEETLEPASFERGHVLIESSSLDRIEFKVDLKVLDEVFPVRISNAELFLWDPRVDRVAQEDHSNGSSSERGDMMVNSVASDAGNSLERDMEEGECPEEKRGASQEMDVGEKEHVMWRGNQLWDAAGEAV